MLDFEGTEYGAILYIFDSIEINIQRNDVPFERLIFTNVNVIAHHRTVLAGTAHAEFYGRIGTDAREIDGAVPGARDSVDAGVQRLVEHNPNVTISPGASKAHEQEGQNTWDGNRAENLSCDRCSRDGSMSEEGDPLHSKVPLDGTWLEWERTLTCAFLTNPTEP